MARPDRRCGPRGVKSVTEQPTAELNLPAEEDGALWQRGAGRETELLDEALRSASADESATVMHQYMAGTLKFTELQLLVESLEPESSAPGGGGHAGGAPGAGVSTQLVAAQRVADFDDVVALTSSASKKRKQRTKTYKKRFELPKQLTNHMGQANHAYVTKDWRKAIQLCNEVITIAPFVPGSYTTLAMVYEEMGDMDKVFHYRKLESVCLPKPSVDWVALARLAVDQGAFDEALHFYDEAARQDRDNLQLHLQRTRLRLRQKQLKPALRGFADAMKCEPLHPVLCQEMVRAAHGVSLTIAAGRHFLDGIVTLYRSSMQQHRRRASTEHVVLLLNLLVKCGRCEEAIEVVREHYCSVETAVPPPRDAQAGCTRPNFARERTRAHRRPPKGPHGP